MFVMDDTTRDVAISTVKVVPPIAVTGMHFLGYGVADWVLALTAVYTILQIVVLVRDKIYYSELKRHEERWHRERVKHGKSEL
jgi:hypothetical protein